MKTYWDRQIGHLIRPVNATGLGGLRGPMIKAQVRARRGLPPRDLASGPAPAGDRLERVKRHERLMARKRAQRQAARRRARPSVANTGINAWRRRQEWLREAENLTLEPL
jgi:hypothetical protein